MGKSPRLPPDGSNYSYGIDRYRTRARQHVGERTTSSATYDKNEDGGSILKTLSKKSNKSEAGGLSEKRDGLGGSLSPSGPTSSGQLDGGGNNTAERDGRGGGVVETSSNDTTEDTVSKPTSTPTRTDQNKSQNEGSGDPALTSDPAPDGTKDKKSIGQRMLAGSKRFVMHMKNALFHSWVNVLLVFVPIGIVVEAAGLSATIIFAMNAIAIIPLAGLLSHATEAVASRLGDTLGALLNVSFGNAVELIIFIIALVKDEIEIVQASLLGSILANLLLILGMAFLLGGLRFREQIYNSTVTQMSACLLSLSVTSLLLPTAFYASFKTNSSTLADQQVLKVSRGVSVVLLLVYVLYLLFQLKSHAYMYESTPQAIIDEESHPGVLADVMNSSSSSDDSSSSDSTDSDTSGSGSVAAAGKKIRKVFRHRRRRKSSASTSSDTATGSVAHSALSSPSTQATQEHQNGFFDATAQRTSRPSSTIAPLPNDDADADHEDNNRDGPRVRDFVKSNTGMTGKAKSAKHKKHRKQAKKHQKSRTQAKETDGATETNTDILGTEMVQSPAPQESSEPKTVGFAEDVAEHSTPGKSKSNMQRLSSRANLPRPALPKMFSNNVFVTPPPQPAPPARPVEMPRSQSSGANLRRTSSLPDRLNQQHAGSAPVRTYTPTRTDPLPPFQHQRSALRDAHAEAINDITADDDEEQEAVMSRTAAVVLLLCSTALVAVCAEFMVDAIPEMIASSPSISQAFIGLIILPIVGNAAEHVTAVTVAAKNKMDLAIGVAVGSSIQIALFVTPVVVLLGWILHTDMSLYFNLFETISLFVTVFVVNFLVLDGRSNYLEGSLLIAAYVIIALGAFFYPAAKDQSQPGGGA